MKCSILIAFAVLLWTNVGADAQNSTTIPLEEIWGYNLPDTQDVIGIPFPEDMEGVGQTYAFLNRDREYNIDQIRQVIASKAPGEKALPGFVLPRDPDSLVLRGVHPALRGKSFPFQRDYPEGEFTLVFFSHPLSYFTRLRKVERTGNEIAVYYTFEPHYTPESTVHFALIPLGKLSAGEYRVTYKQEPIDKKYREVGFEPVHPGAADIVCRDFVFKVVESPQNAEPSLEGAKLIPLDQIWANEMPGTRSVRELESKIEGNSVRELIDKSLVLQLDRELKKRREQREATGSAFIVVGQGKEALEKAHEILAKRIEPNQSFPPDTDLSLVFYSYMSGGYYVHIDSVERTERTFTVKYRFEFHETGDATSHFAIIPLGKLQSGTYQVKIKQLPQRRGPIPRGLTWLVCGDTSFQVERILP